MNDKIALGTVQFGTVYGINNSTGIPADDEIAEIFAEAYKNGINTIDTASAYGLAESKIGQFAPQAFDVVTKVSSVNSAYQFQQCLENSLVQLQRPSVYALLAHNADALLSGPLIWELLLAAKASGLTKKAGYSLYTPEQLDRAIKMNMIPDIVQVPYSVFDRRFEQHFPLLKKANCEIHVRSVFLQGLYFKQPASLPENLKDLGPALAELNQICRQERISINKLAINFPLLNPHIDKVVIGVEKLEQLQKNLADLADPDEVMAGLVKCAEIEIEDKHLLNPANW